MSGAGVGLPRCCLFRALCPPWQFSASPQQQQRQCLRDRCLRSQEPACAAAMARRLRLVALHEGRLSSASAPAIGHPCMPPMTAYRRRAAGRNIGLTPSPTPPMARLVGGREPSTYVASLELRATNCLSSATTTRATANLGEDTAFS